MVIITKSTDQGWLPQGPVDLMQERRRVLLAATERRDNDELELSLRTGFAGTLIGGVCMALPYHFWNGLGFAWGVRMLTWLASHSAPGQSHTGGQREGAQLCELGEGLFRTSSATVT